MVTVSPRRQSGTGYGHGMTTGAGLLNGFSGLVFKFYSLFFSFRHHEL